VNSENNLDNNLSVIQNNSLGREAYMKMGLAHELQVYDIKDAAHKEIFDRITQDIFNDTLAKW
jgi:hypothetical protein